MHHVDSLLGNIHWAVIFANQHLRIHTLVRTAVLFSAPPETPLLCARFPSRSINHNCYYSYYYITNVNLALSLSFDFSRLALGSIQCALSAIYFYARAFLFSEARRVLGMLFSTRYCVSCSLKTHTHQSASLSFPDQCSRIHFMRLMRSNAQFAQQQSPCSKVLRRDGNCLSMIFSRYQHHIITDLKFEQNGLFLKTAKWPML